MPYKHVEALLALGVILTSRLAMGDHIELINHNMHFRSVHHPYPKITWSSTHGAPPGHKNDFRRLSCFEGFHWCSISHWQASGRLGTSLPTPSFKGLACSVDASLFQSICCNPDQVLAHYFIDIKPTGHNLHPRAHNFALPCKDSKFCVQSVALVPLNCLISLN